MLQEWHGTRLAFHIVEDLLAEVCFKTQAHHKDLKTLLGNPLPEPPEDATALEKTAYKLSTEIGQAIYRLRKCNVEPVIGIIKEILGFRQFSLRDLKKVAGEWCLVCLAFNLKRLHVLMTT